ncbi:NAD(P)H-dependent oxidoreductase [Sinorhizobium sp. 7-81]|uniref:NAD(P)H-dependent oxidoreductase n=1 Tax=Sinorhizobium sp. 8-89 TaxID=3049089 RepID=UPI0024C30EA7|nr:NAD(P)H-dependent oxidoreductase [Sinorhizobium sp. 8-89]MDK1494849.1 NAD(P)H-dependent oxidoreductase [Sinorhizobium sp. 8-89]
MFGQAANSDFKRTLGDAKASTLSFGGFYGPGSPAESFEHTLSYLKSVFAFIGITDPEVIVADGVNISSEQRESSLKEAKAQIADLKAA